LLLLGAAATEYFDGGELANDCTVVRCDAVTAIRAEFATKKALWLTISQYALR
jgi:hypothetical protein